MKFRIALILLLFFVFSNKATSQNFVMVENQQGFVNETNIFQILLINNDPVRAVQFDVELPVGFILDVNNVAITDRTAGFAVTASYLSGTTYRVILFSTNNLLLDQGDTSIITLAVLIDGSITPGVYSFNFSNVIISDATNQDISTNPLENGEIIIVVANSPSLIELCDEVPNDGTGVFDLTIREAQILGVQTGLTVTYHQTQADAISGTNPIVAPNSYSNSTNPEDVYPRLMEPTTGYFDTTILTLTVVPAPTPTSPTPLEVCDDNSDGIAAFNLLSKTDEILNGEINVSISYHETSQDAINGVNELVSPYVNIIAVAQTVFVRAESDITACLSFVELDLKVNTPPDVNPVTDYNVVDNNNDGIEAFDLTTRIPEILGSQNPTDFQVTFYEALLDAQADINAIVVPTAYINTTNPQTIYVRITNISTSCFSLNEFILFADPDLGNGNFIASNIILYPNPTSGELFIEGILDNEIEVGLFTFTGQALFFDKLNQYNGAFSIDLSDLKVGLYFINISFKETQQSFKIMIN